MRAKRIPGFIVLFLAADAALVVLYLVGWRIGGLYWKVDALLDPKGYAGLVNWYTSSKLFLIACGFALFARHETGRGTAVSWLLPLIPVLFLALSFDEIAQVSTWLGYKSARILPPDLLRGGSPREHQAILALATALGVLVAALTYSIARYTAGRWDIRGKYAIGALAFIGAVTIEGATAVARLHTVGGALRVAGEELATLLGTTLILWATHDLLAAHHLIPAEH